MANRKTPLSETERTYLQIATEPNGPDSGDLEKLKDPSYIDRPDKLHKKIRDRVESLPNRTDGLLEEIELLTDAGYLEVGQRTDLKEYLRLFQGGEFEELPFEPYRHSLTEGTDTNQSLFGKRLAHAAVCLLFAPDFVDESDVKLELSAGFIEGLMDYTNKDEFLTELSNLIDAELEQRMGMPDIHADGVDTIEEIADTLHENGVNLPPPAEAKVIRHIEHEYGEKPSKQHIMDAVTELRIKERQALQDDLKTDLNELEEHEWNGITGLTVMQNMARVENQVSEVAEEISSEMDIDRASALPAVGRFARFLSGEEVHSWGQRATPNVIHLQKSGEIMQDWSMQLTDYGKVLVASSMSQLHFAPLAGISEDMVAAALDELNG